MSHQKNAGQIYNMKVANKFFENVLKVKYFVTILTNKN